MYTYVGKDCELEVTSKYIGGKPMPDLPKNTNYHIISVRNKKTGIVETFEFWNSLVCMNRTKKVCGKEFRDLELHEDELRNALMCIVDDAIAGDTDIDEFVSEFCYGNEKVSKVLRIYNACQETKKKLLDLLDCQVNTLCDISNKLREEENAN